MLSILFITFIYTMAKKLKKISTNIPEGLLKTACRCTNLNQTEALIAGLRELIAQHERKALTELKGKVAIDLDLDQLRQRIRL